MTGRDALLAGARRYYAARLREHGTTARGVDWNSAEGQTTRFAQLARLWAQDRAPFSIVDFGCGYGALVDFLEDSGVTGSYTGIDLCEEMVAAARERYADRPACRFTTEASDIAPADYAVASGVFNVKQDTPEADWQAYVLEAIDRLAALGTRGFACNLLTRDSDPARRRPDLYYADPEAFFAHCRQRFSRRVSVLQDYGLYEFTLIVRKDGPARD